MNVSRYLNEERVDFHLDAVFDEDNPPTVEAVADHMVSLLESSDAVVNANKLRNDLVQRERRAPSLLGEGIALPHVRTLQARRLIMAVGVSQAGLDLGADDGEPIRLVIALVGPTYDDKAYLQLYKRLSERLTEDSFVQSILNSEHPGEVVRALSR